MRTPAYPYERFCDNPVSTDNAGSAVSAAVCVEFHDGPLSNFYEARGSTDGEARTASRPSQPGLAASPWLVVYSIIDVDIAMAVFRSAFLLNQHRQLARVMNFV